MRKTSLSTKIALSFILLLSIALCEDIQAGGAEVEIPQPIIFSVATDLGNPSNTLYGSLNGGTRLYIECENVSLNPEDNVVTVGPYPCPTLDNGHSDSYIVCETTAATGP